MSTADSDFESLKSYFEYGVTISKGLLPKNLVNEAAELSNKLIEQAKFDPDSENAFWRIQGQAKYLEKIEPVVDLSEVLKSIIFHPRIIDLASSVLRDEKEPYLFKDKLIFKAPGQDGYPLHQDFNWWHSYPADAICTVVIPLDKVNEMNGGIEFFLGCHSDPFLPKGENRELNSDEEQLVDGFDSKIFALEPGDVLVFHSLTPHCSYRNMSNAWRRQLYPTYNNSSIGDRYSEQLRIQRRNEYLRHTNNEYGIP